MARGKKKKARPVQRKAKKQSDPELDAVTELIGLLACPKNAVNELALSCENVLDQMDVACGFARFASRTWSQRTGQFGEIDEIARALIVEYERHAEALSHLLDRLAPLAQEDEHDDHEDLDPMDVLERVQPMLVAPDEAQA